MHLGGANCSLTQAAKHFTASPAMPAHTQLTEHGRALPRQPPHAIHAAVTAYSCNASALCRHRPLAPGQYVVEASYPGMANASSSVVVPVDGSGIVLSFQLVPANSKSKVRGIEECCLPGSQ